MKRSNYKKRLIDDQIEKYLSAFGAVCIEGPKWCGKTWTSEYHSNSEFYVGSPAGNFSNRALAEMSPDLVMQGDTPRLIDEWQEVPSLWDAVRAEVDRRGEKGQFILTGSSTPDRKGVLHSGAGRIARLKMRPMTLFESGRSSGDVSLRDLCDGRITPAITGDVSLVDLIDYIVRGGWPDSQEISLSQAALIPLSYIDSILNYDIPRLEGIRYDVAKMHLLLRSLARNESTAASIETLTRDVADEGGSIHRDTVQSYLNTFDRLFLTENQPPFSEKIRSSVRIKQSSKRHFVDPSLAVALLGATPEMLLNDLETLGFLFEAMCERDLRVFAESMGAALFHYQDYADREIDAVIEMKDGSWCACEIKLGANQIDKAAEKLLTLAESIKKDGGKPPAVCCVISGLSNAAYQRKDGVFVVPITALRN